jgi:hypothetical protein
MWSRALILLADVWRAIGLSQGVYLHRTTQIEDKTCQPWKSNPRSKCSGDITARCALRLMNCQLSVSKMLTQIMYVSSCVILTAPSVQSQTIPTLTRRSTSNTFSSRVNAPFVWISLDCIFLVTFLETGEFCVISSLMTDDWCSLLNVRAIVTSGRVTWAVYGVRMGLKRTEYRIWVRKPAGRGLLGRSRHRWSVTLKYILKEYYWGSVVDYYG